MITGLPGYRPPTAEPVRCYCRSFFLVYVGSEDYEARQTRQQAQEQGAIFIDARVTPFFECKCGQILDFAPECVLTIQ